MVSFEKALKAREAQLDERSSRIDAEKIGVDDLINNFRDTYSKIISLKESND